MAILHLLLLRFVPAQKQIKHFVHQPMDLLPADAFADPLGHGHRHFVFHLLQRLAFVSFQGDDGASPAVQLHKAFLPQHRIGFIYRMHVDADMIRQLANRRKRISLPDSSGGYPHDNLIPQLHIQRLITVKINPKNHLLHHLSLYLL